MGLGGFTLADRLGAKSSPCTVPGCARTWISMVSAKGAKLGGRGAADPADPSSSMCDPCRQVLAKAADAQRPCERPGCDGTWTWTALDQVAAAANNRKPPHKLCAGCEEKLAALSDQKSPCAVPGCARQAVFTRQAQLVAGAPDAAAAPPALRCDQCEGVYRKLKDRSTTCGINGCKEKWLWSADEQIQAYAAGLPNEPPRRMGAHVRGGLRRHRRPPGALPRPPAARRPGPGAAAISSTPAWPASRRPRRRTACARAASRFTRH